MEKTNKELVGNYEVDQTIVDKMVKKIITAERTNLNTQEKNNAEMSRYIKKMIEEEFECY